MTAAIITLEELKQKQKQKIKDHKKYLWKQRVIEYSGKWQSDHKEQHYDTSTTKQRKNIKLS